MTIFEFFKKQFDEKVADGCGTTKVCCISESVPKGSFRWVQIASKMFFGGALQQTLEKNGITYQQLQSAKEQGILKYWYDSSWFARQMGETSHWALTVKGVRALYNEYKGQW